MKSFSLMTALILYSFSWISISTSESHTMGVQSGEEVTLLCSNISEHTTHTDWFRLVNRTKPSCISSMYWSNGEASYCDGFKDGRVKMSTNISTVFLQIKQVDNSDTGLYFCGFYIDKHTVIGTATYLDVDGESESGDEVDLDIEKEPEEKTNLVTLVLAALTVLLTVIIILLAVKIKKLQTAVNEELRLEMSQELTSDNLNYAAVTFQKKPKRARRPASETEMEKSVIYAATR